MAPYLSRSRSPATIHCSKVPVRKLSAWLISLSSPPPRPGTMLAAGAWGGGGEVPTHSLAQPFLHLRPPTLTCRYNVKMQAFFTVRQKTIANGNTVNSELEDGNDCCDNSSDDPSVPLLGQGKAEQTGAGTPCH